MKDYDYEVRLAHCGTVQANSLEEAKAQIKEDFYDELEEEVIDDEIVFLQEAK